MTMAHERYKHVHAQTRQEIAMIMSCCPVWFGDHSKSLRYDIGKLTTCLAVIVSLQMGVA